MAEVIASIAYPRVKKVRPVPSYRGLLTIGDPDKFDDAIAIDVERYPRTKKASALSASKYVPPQESQGSTTATESAIQGGSVALQRLYKIKRGEEEVEVEKDELDKAYLYGRTIINVSDADQSVTKLETTAELGILGFVEKSGVTNFIFYGVLRFIV
jgi:ATP-dependent DNA helicase 2 subunit 2